MDNRNSQEKKPLQQAAENPTSNATDNPFDNNVPVDQEIQEAQEELDKEQTFKEAQSERD